MKQTYTHTYTHLRRTDSIYLNPIHVVDVYTSLSRVLDICSTCCGFLLFKMMKKEQQQQQFNLRLCDRRNDLQQIDRLTNRTTKCYSVQCTTHTVNLILMLAYEMAFFPFILILLLRNDDDNTPLIQNVCTNKVKMNAVYVFIDLSLYEVDLSIHTYVLG